LILRLLPNWPRRFCSASARPSLNAAAVFDARLPPVADADDADAEDEAVAGEAAGDAALLLPGAAAAGPITPAANCCCCWTGMAAGTTPWAGSNLHRTQRVELGGFTCVHATQIQLREALMCCCASRN